MERARCPPIIEFLYQKPLLGHHDFQLVEGCSVCLRFWLYHALSILSLYRLLRNRNEERNFMLHRFPKCHRGAQFAPLGGAQATLHSNGVRACFTGDKSLSGALNPLFFPSAWTIKGITSLKAWNQNDFSLQHGTPNTNVYKIYPTLKVRSWRTLSPGEFWTMICR